MIRILIADDHKIVRQGLKQFIALAPDLQVVAEAATGQEVVESLARSTCDVLLLDLAMPGLSGVELIKKIRQASAPPHILVLSMHNEGQAVSRTLKAGAAGYLTKDSDPEMLITAIRKVAGGGRYIDPSLVDRIVFDQALGDDRPPHSRLSDREFHVFQRLLAGDSINTIADNLSISAKTVSTHKLRLMQKMQMESMTELIRYAVQHQLMTV
ncbi:response regulator [Massilia sp. X63]|uniref:response regulator n=1 Tax=Massilia sp. X63 TaxID=3237285 RepID=UPI0034DCF84A